MGGVPETTRGIGRGRAGVAMGSKPLKRVVGLFKRPGPFVAGSIVQCTCSAYITGLSGFVCTLPAAGVPGLDRLNTAPHRAAALARIAVRGPHPISQRPRPRGAGATRPPPRAGPSLPPRTGRRDSEGQGRFGAPPAPPEPPPGCSPSGHAHTVTSGPRHGPLEGDSDRHSSRLRLRLRLRLRQKAPAPARRSDVLVSGSLVTDGD